MGSQETTRLPTGVPQRLVDTVQRCLSTDPADRPSAAELQAQLAGAPPPPVLPVPATELQAQSRHATSAGAARSCHGTASPTHRRATSAGAARSCHGTASPTHTHATTAVARPRSAATRRAETGVSQTAQADAGHHGDRGTGTGGRRLGGLALLSHPPQLPAAGCGYCADFLATTCDRAAERFAESEDASARACSLRSFARCEVQRSQTSTPGGCPQQAGSACTLVDGDRALPGARTDAQCSAQRTRYHPRPRQGRGAGDRRSLRHGRRRAAEGSRAELVFRPPGKGSGKKMDLRPRGRAGHARVAAEIRVHAQRRHRGRCPGS